MGRQMSPGGDYIGIWESFKSWLVESVLGLKLIDVDTFKSAVDNILNDMDTNHDDEITVRELIKAIKMYLK